MEALSRTPGAADRGRRRGAGPGGATWRSGEVAHAPPKQGPSEWFTGTVRMDRCSMRRTGAGCGRERDVQAGARTAWHTHPLGQTLIVTAGLRPGAAMGWADGRRFGRVTWSWFPPGEKHWHGATAATAMTHLAIQEKTGWQGGRVDGARDGRAGPRPHRASSRLGPEGRPDVSYGRTARTVNGRRR